MTDEQISRMANLVRDTEQVTKIKLKLALAEYFKDLVATSTNLDEIRLISKITDKVMEL